jgi:hypothetical protein
MATAPLPPQSKSKFVAFFDKTGVKIAYATLAFTLAVMMFFIAADTGSLFDWAILVLLLYIGVFDTVTVVRRLRNRTGSAQPDTPAKKGRRGE